MEINQIVIDQIKHSFKNTDTKEFEVIGVQISETSRIDLLSDNGIRLSFKRHKEIDEEYITTFFRERISTKDVTIYYRKHSISIYTRYSSRAEGVDKFKRAMDIFKNFKNLHDQYIIFSRLIATV